MLIIGEKEENEGVISVRSRDEGELGQIKVEEFLDAILEKIETRENIAEFIEEK